ncbi:MAG: hypothetical protein ACLFVB_05745 [Thermoplasmata archaeon]
MIWTLVISGMIIVFALGLFIISILSYQKFRNKKLLFVSIVFSLLFIKGLISALSVFIDYIPESNLFPYSGLIDLGILTMLYLATLKR